MTIITVRVKYLDVMQKQDGVYRLFDGYDKTTLFWEDLFQDGTPLIGLLISR